MSLALQQNNGGGGSPIVTPQVAYITSAGSDTTGNGSLTKPFRTAQKAFDSDFYYWNLGANFNAGSVNFGGTETVTLYIFGAGYTSVLGVLTNHGQQLQVYDIGVQSFSVSGIDTSATELNGGGVDIFNVLVQPGGIDTHGINSGNGGTVNVTKLCDVSGSINTQGDNTGNGGAVNISRGAQAVGDINTSGGEGGGTDGAISITFATAIGTLTPNSATVQAAIVGGIFYGNTYPLPSTTTTPVTSVSNVGDTISAIS